MVTAHDALEDLNRPTESRSPNRRSILSRIRPAVQTLLETDLANDHDELITHAVHANIRASVDGLRHGSEILEQLIDADELVVVGAEYSIETGIVSYLDRPQSVA